MKQQTMTICTKMESKIAPHMVCSGMLIFSSSSVSAGYLDDQSQTLVQSSRKGHGENCSHVLRALDWNKKFISTLQAHSSVRLFVCDLHSVLEHEKHPLVEPRLEILNQVAIAIDDSWSIPTSERWKKVKTFRTLQSDITSSEATQQRTHFHRWPGSQCWLCDQALTQAASSRAPHPS